MAVTPTKNRGRPYSVMLLLAFAAAVMGVMALNKLREGQAHNILIDEKDREITALNLRYQREEGFSKELRSKIKDMRAKIESLRNQKKNLKSKLEEMQSLTSLKEKHRTRVAALKEKQKQIEKPREKKGLTRKMYTQLVALKEALKQKEDEIHELKRQHQNPPSIQSVVSNGTSNSPTNDTVIKIVLDGDNSTDKEQEAVSKDHQANVDVVKKEQGNETPPDMNANKQIEDARAVAGKQQENLASVNELPEKGTTQHIDGISKPEDSKVDAVNQPEKVERDDVKRLGNRQSDNAKSRQGETIVLVTNFDQPENPQNSTKDKQLKNREPDAADFKLENKDTDGHANTLPNGHVFKDRREKLEDADVKQNGQKDESEKMA